MNLRCAALAACLASAVGTAAAQPGWFAAYSLAFGSPTGPSMAHITPGASIDLFVNVYFSPGTGSPQAVALSDGGFSISATASQGSIWSVDSNTASPTYSLPNPWGAQAVGGLGVSPGTGGPGGVRNVYWGYGFLFSWPHPFPQNPATVWRGRFTAGLEPVVVHAWFTDLTPTGVFAYGGSLPTVASYHSTSQGGSITIVPATVPAPASAALFGLGGVMVLRRQRTSSEGGGG